MSGIFSITGSHINQISTEGCVELFGELLHADARRIKIPITNVTFTTKTIPDGGIDASVEGDLSEKGDLIIDSKSFYQIKAGETFEPWQEAVIKKELFGNKDSMKENLGTEVLRCFESNGTYILVCMKVSLSTDQTSKAEEYLRNFLTGCGIPDPKIKVWGREKIVGIVSGFPSLSLRLSGRDKAIFNSHEDWAQQTEMKRGLVLGTEQEKFIKIIKESLLDDSEAIHLNVFGETGVGKTRLIFEATKDHFLAPLTLYISSPKIFKDSFLMNEIIRDATLQVILVIDECDLNERLYIWDKLKNLGSRLKIVTIYNEFRKTIGNTKQIQAPNLANDKISKIIQMYYNDNIIAGQLAGLCGGIPRYAHVIGLDLKNNPKELLKGIPDTAEIFDRYLNYGEDPDSDWVRQRKWILHTVSLFKKFGFGENFKDEMNAVHKLIQKIDNNVTLAKFQDHIKQLKDRKILQGEDTLYISPKALHLWLWMNWWENYSSGFDFEELVKELPTQLRLWFFDMFEYAANSEVTKSIVTGLFSETGPLRDSNSIKTALGAKFFHSLALVDPKAATDYLEKTMATWPKNELKEFGIGRREVIYGLERIVFEPELFTRGGVLLRDLAEAENEEWSNNATGLFTNLFSLGPGYVSITKTSPSMRLLLLKETLCSESEFKRNLGLKACESALQAMHFTRASGLTGDELRIDQKGWEPKTYKEWQEAYEGVIELLIEKIKTFPKNDQNRSAEIIFSHARGLIRALPAMGEYITSKLSELTKYIDKETALKNIIDILEFEKERLKPEIKTKLEELQGELTGKDYSSLMKRYVGMNIMMDLSKKDHEKEREEKIKQLVKESLDLEKLKSQLPWLVTTNAKYGYKFGYELSTLDEEKTLLPTLLEFQRDSNDNGSGFFLGGYLLKIYEKNKEEWNKIMTDLSKDQKLLRFFPELAWRSGITDEIGLLLLELIKEEKVGLNELSQFYLGGAVNKLSTNVVEQWIVQMLQSDEQNIVFNALGLFDSFFVHRQEKSLNVDLTLKILTHKVLFDKDYPTSYDTMVDFYWKSIALKFIEQHSDKSLQIAEKMLEHMGIDGTIIRTHSQAMEVLDKIAFQFPNETWDLVTRYIDLPFDERGFAIINWMRGGMFDATHSFLESVDYRKIFDWIDHDPHKRASYIANYAPPYLRKERCLARELLKKYGKEESVRTSLSSNFVTGGFSGSASQHYQKIKDDMLTYKESEDDENVKDWIDFHVSTLDEDINREKLREEREF